MAVRENAVLSDVKCPHQPSTSLHTPSQLQQDRVETSTFTPDVPSVIGCAGRRSVFVSSVETRGAQRQSPKIEALFRWQGAPLHGAGAERSAVAREQKRVPHPEAARHLHQAANEIAAEMPGRCQWVQLDQGERGRNRCAEARRLHERDKDVVMRVRQLSRPPSVEAGSESGSQPVAGSTMEDRSPGSCPRNPE